MPRFGMAEFVCFICTILQGIAAAVYISSTFAPWLQRRRGGDMTPLVIKHPLLLLALFLGCVLTGCIGLWLQFRHAPSSAAGVAPAQMQPISPSQSEKPRVLKEPRINTPTKSPRRSPEKEALPPSMLPKSGNQTTIESGAVIQQNTSGDCSPAIIGSRNTTNCGQPPKPDRHIPESRKQELIDLLKEKPSKVQICAFVNNREAFGFAQDWYQILDQAGWEIQEKRIVPFISSIPWAGVQVGYSDAKPMAGLKQIPIPQDEFQVILIVTGLDRLRIKDITGNPDPTQSRDLVILRIGDNP